MSMQKAGLENNSTCICVWGDNFTELILLDLVCTESMILKLGQSVSKVSLLHCNYGYTPVEFTFFLVSFYVFLASKHIAVWPCT